MNKKIEKIEINPNRTYKGWRSLVEKRDFYEISKKYGFKGLSVIDMIAGREER